ncbi:hypothetical protein AN958_12261, partial [Leucoagaricus sp. SymC.cos]
LIDSECTHTCISEEKVKKLRLPLKLDNRAFEVFNIDGSPSSHKSITHYTNITLITYGHKEQVGAVVIILDSADIFLEYDWLIYHNSKID